ncbi:partial soluble lytic murein transglycosylase, partial [biofilm metagenome]
MMKINSFIKLFSFFAVLSVSPLISADKLSEQRSSFLQAVKYLNEKNEVSFSAVSAVLTDYPLYSYLRYLRLKENLADSGQIVTFLSTYKDTRYAALLRGKWLDYLTDKQQWDDYLQHYLVDEDSKDDCRFHWARHQTGNKEPAMAEAKRLWLSGKVAEKNCQTLFAALEKSSLINQSLIWQRFETALLANRAGTAESAAALLKGENRKRAEIWLLLHSKPSLINEPRFWTNKDEETGRLFAHTIIRLANSNLDKATIAWDKRKHGFIINTETNDAVAHKLGFSLLGKKDSRAYNYLNLIKNPDPDERLSKVRAALLEQNWQHVDSALAGLTPDQRQLPQWQYWQARMLAQTGRKTQAQTLYKSLANDRSYYGFNAADKTNSAYRIPDVPLTVGNAAIEDLAVQPDFLAAREFKLIGNDLESRRQWQYAINKLPKEKLIVAAKLAQQWQWDQLAITTLVKADYWDDLSIRFPIAYQNEIETGAAINKVDSALLFGLMRQESMLDKNAVSPVGARGLMQIMPETAVTIAKALNEPWVSANDLFKPE